MNRLLKVSDAANLAMHGAAILAADPDRNMPAKDLAARLEASEATLAKAMQRLVHAGLATSVSGPSGGFRLGREARKITLKEILEAVEGPLIKSECLFGRAVCGRDSCMLGDLVGTVDRMVAEKLARTTLADVAKGMEGMK